MKLASSFKVAFRGIGMAIVSQSNLKIHIVAAAVVICAGFYLSISNIEWIVLLLTIGLVISLELVNTAIEELVNLIAPEMNKKAGRIKDIAAGAVLVAAIVAVIVAFMIFWKYLVA